MIKEIMSSLKKTSFPINIIIEAFLAFVFVSFSSCETTLLKEHYLLLFRFCLHTSGRVESFLRANLKLITNKKKPYAL